jgi:hypothetical protein
MLGSRETGAWVGTQPSSFRLKSITPRPIRFGVLQWRFSSYSPLDRGPRNELHLTICGLPGCLRSGKIIHGIQELVT